MDDRDRPAGRAFISYVWADAPDVDVLQARLEGAGIRVWRDVDDLWPGQDWAKEIRRAISTDSLVFIACFSSNSASRQVSFQNEELILAIEQLRLRKPDVPWLIPVRFDDCEIPDLDIGAGRTLRSIQRVDFFGDRREEQAGRLVLAVGRILGRDPGLELARLRARRGEVRRLDLARFVALSTYAAADELGFVADRDAVELLAGAPAEFSADVLGVLMQNGDQDRLLTLLADMNRSKAQSLVDTMASADEELEWLRPLPGAAAAIARCAARMRPDLGAASGRLERAGTSEQGTEGFWWQFEHGGIHWSARSGAQATIGPIADYHHVMGGSWRRLGFPLTPAKPVEGGFSETTGLYQCFESSSDYDQETCAILGLSCGATVYWSEHGTHATWGSIGEFYERGRGAAGLLGFPVSDEAEVGPSLRDEEVGTTGWCQWFEGGAVYFSEKTKAIAVLAAIADHHERQHHGVASKLGFPVSKMLEAKPSPQPYNTSGYFQRFEGRRDYDRDILKHWSEGEGPGGATIYTSAAHGAHCVRGGNGNLYERLGGTGSWLGFPKSDEVEHRSPSNDQLEYKAQEFEGGVIIRRPEHGSVAIPRSTMVYLDHHEGLSERLGLPLRRPLMSAADEPVQFFENGVVVIRDGISEAYLKAVPSPEAGAQRLHLVALNFSPGMVMRGQPIILEYEIQALSDPPSPVMLGATLLAENGNEYFDKASDLKVEVTPGQASYRRPLYVPSSAPPGTYCLIAAVWYPAIGKQRLARLDRGFVVTVTTETSE